MMGERMKTENRVTLIKHPEKSIEKVMIKFVQDHPANRRHIDGGKYWDTPLVGFASCKGEDQSLTLQEEDAVFPIFFCNVRKVSGSLNSCRTCFSSLPGNLRIIPALRCRRSPPRQCNQSNALR